MSISASSAIFRLCGSFRQSLLISPMSSTVKKTPKRPRNAFSLFWLSKIDNLPKGKDSLLEASRLWRSMSDSEKKPFQISSKKEMDEFVKPIQSEEDVVEKNIRALKKKVRKYTKERKDILSGRVLKKKISPYNVYIGEVWKGGKGIEASTKWQDLSQQEKLQYEKKAEVLNNQRDLEYGKNPLTVEEELAYVELSEKILQLKKQINSLEKSTLN